MERPRVHSSWALIQVEASFFINTKNKFGFFICQVHGFLSGLNYSLELQKKKHASRFIYRYSHQTFLIYILLSCLLSVPSAHQSSIWPKLLSRSKWKWKGFAYGGVINSFYVQSHILYFSYGVPGVFHFFSYFNYIALEQINAYYVALLVQIVHVSLLIPVNHFQTPPNIYFRLFLRCVTFLGTLSCFYSFGL